MESFPGPGHYEMPSVVGMKDPTLTKPRVSDQGTTKRVFRGRSSSLPRSCLELAREQNASRTAISRSLRNQVVVGLCVLLTRASEHICGRRLVHSSKCNVASAGESNRKGCDCTLVIEFGIWLE